MKRLLSQLLVWGLLSLGTLAQAEPIALITHRDSPQRELNSNDEQLQALFYDAVADMSLTRLKAYWARLVFSGQGRPPPRIALNIAVDRISRNNAAVTYVYANAIPRDAKVLLRLQ